MLQNSVFLKSTSYPLVSDDCDDYDLPCTATTICSSFTLNSHTVLPSSICGMDVGEIVAEEETSEEHATPFVTPSIARASQRCYNQPDVPARMPSRQQSFRRQDSDTDLMSISVRRQHSSNRHMIQRQASFRRQGSFRGLHHQESSSLRTLDGSEQAGVTKTFTDFQPNHITLSRQRSLRMHGLLHKQTSFRKERSFRGCLPRQSSHRLMRVPTVTSLLVNDDTHKCCFTESIKT